MPRKKPAKAKKTTPAAKPVAPASKEELLLKQVSDLFLSCKYYPVAVDEAKKESAKKQVLEAYKKGEDYLKHNVLYICNEMVFQYIAARAPHTYDFFKAQSQNPDAAKLKLNVYRSMFNYNSSLEGVIEVIDLVASLGDMASAKLLTRFYLFFSSHENEASRMLRNAVVDALGASDSIYALKALIKYARFAESEKTFHRIISSLLVWQDKIGSLEIPADQKESAKKELETILMISKPESGGYVG